MGLTEPSPLAGLAGVLASCFAVIPTYLAAREPGVMLVGGGAVVRPGVTKVLVAEGRGRAEGVCRLLGVLRPVDAAGVTRPLDIEGVILPFENEGVFRPLGTEGVFLPFPMEGKADGVILPEAEKEGVILPLRTDATEDGLEWPTVGADNLVDATKTPQFGGHVKYCFL